MLYHFCPFVKFSVVLENQREASQIQMGHNQNEYVLTLINYERITRVYSLRLEFIK